MLEVPTLNFNFIRDAWARRAVLVPALVVLWLLFAAWNLFSLVDNGVTIVTSAISSLSRPAQAPYPFGSPEVYAFQPSPGTPFALSLWGLWAALFLWFRVIPKRPNLSNWRRFALGGATVSKMLCQVVIAVPTSLFAQMAQVPRARAHT